MQKRFLAVLLALCLVVNLPLTSVLAGDTAANALAVEAAADTQTEETAPDGEEENASDGQEEAASDAEEAVLGEETEETAPDGEVEEAVPGGEGKEEAASEGEEKESVSDGEEEDAVPGGEGKETAVDGRGEEEVPDGQGEDTHEDVSGSDIQIGEEESAGEVQADEEASPAEDAVLPEDKEDVQAPEEEDIMSAEEDPQTPQEDGTLAEEDGDAEDQEYESMAYANTENSGNCGENLTWSLDDNGVLTISGTGPMENYGGFNYAPWRGASVHEVIICPGVTTIGARAFCDCRNLTGITIPDSVTSIGDGAFFWCIVLTSITIPDSVTSIGREAFSDCHSLTSITIPDSVTTIGEAAFSVCGNLTSITIPDSVTSIGGSAFKWCSSLTSITIPDSVTSIGWYAFYGCSSLTSITLSDSLTSIEEDVFSGCGNLTSITIPDSMTSIGDGAFMWCSSLTSITIPDSVTSIGKMPFIYCTSLQAIYVGVNNANYCSENGILFNKDKTLLIRYPEYIGQYIGQYMIPSSVTSIGDYAFAECSGLTSITIPDSVTSIGDYGFSGCSSLTSITIPDSVTTIGDGAFERCSSLTSITIPDSVTTISFRAFDSCSSLTSITLPESVTSIGQCAFDSCSSLTSITIPDSVTAISFGAFYGCSSLTSITLPDNVTSIGDGAFERCSSLTSLMLPDRVTSIGKHTFDACISLTSITIPDSVISIGSAAFFHCSNLADIYYGGSESDWEAITVGGDNDPLATATIHYNSTGPDDIEDPEPTSTPSPEKPPVTPPPTQSGTDTSIKSRKIGFYSPIGNRVFEMDMDWGWDLFLKGSSTGYDYRLAKVGLALSGAAERSRDAVESMLTDGNIDGLGFDSEMKVSANYGREWYELGFPAVTFGHKSIKLANGEKSHIIAIVIRGTTDNADWCTDVWSIRGAFNWSADNTYGLLQTYIKNCSMNTGEVNKDNVKFFITGHSLGGAVSNILAQKLNDEYGAENVFAYTFASPRSTKAFDKASNNIHNILNAEDMVPVFLSTQLRRFGDNIWFSRNEYAEDIYRNFDLITGGKNLQSVMNSWNIVDRFFYGHAVETYMSYLCTRGSNANIPPANIKILQVFCPVDVEIYVDDGTEEGLLVGRVTDNVVDETVAPGVYIEVEGDEKYVHLMYEGDYRIKLVGTDSGTMEYSVQEVELNSGNVIEEKTFENVLLADGKEMTSAVSVWNKNDHTTDADSKIDTSEVQLFVLDSEGIPEKEVLPDGNGTEVPIASPEATYSITFDANGGTVETVSMDTGTDGRLSELPTPARSGYDFKGWYTATEGGEQVGTDTVFEKDTTVYAQWTKVDDDETPDKPGSGNDSETPDKPGSGNDSETPDKPGSGNDSETPDKPGSGNDSETPDKPGSGNDSETPDKPGSGNDSEMPDKPGSGNDSETPDKPDSGNSNGASGDSGATGGNETSQEPNANESRTIQSPQTGEEGRSAGIVEILGIMIFVGMLTAVIGLVGRRKEKRV